MTKSNKNLLLGAAVVVGAIYLYRRNQKVASGEETSSFLGFGRRAGRRTVRAGGGGYSACPSGRRRCKLPHDTRCLSEVECRHHESNLARASKSIGSFARR